MQHVTAVLSMLHEASATSSASRVFRQQPVLAWTLQRLAMARRLTNIAILCWEDQLKDVSPIANDRDAHILSKSPRIALPSLDAIAAARRWADGWRGGLLGTCDFDRGFHAQWIGEILQRIETEAVMLVDPAAGLVDPKLIDHMIEHAEAHESVELCFTQAAPGLSGTLLRRALVERLAQANTHPGKLLCYLPDQPMRDPISGDGCVAVPTAVARTTRNFRLDSDRQISRLTDAAVNLNGQLVRSDAEDLLNRLIWTRRVDPLPRDVVIEINTARATSPIYSPLRAGDIERAPMTLETAGRIFEQLSAADDVRVTFGGVGDPLLHDRLFDFIELARSAGISAIHVETDLLPADPGAVDQLADSRIDVVSLYLPAMTPQTYREIMGVDRFQDVLENVRRFVTRRHQRGGGLPILAPTLVKCRQNLGEMEQWYDQWLRALGSAVIVGPSTYAGLIADCGVADMSPPRRRACARLWSRMTILSDGRVPSCEQDVLGRQVVGDVAEHSIAEIWRDRFTSLRMAHENLDCGAKPLCAGCRDWHRP